MAAGFGLAASLTSDIDMNHRRRTRTPHPHTGSVHTHVRIDLDNYLCYNPCHWDAHSCSKFVTIWNFDLFAVPNSGWRLPVGYPNITQSSNMLCTFGMTMTDSKSQKSLVNERLMLASGHQYFPDVPLTHCLTPDAVCPGR